MGLTEQRITGKNIKIKEKQDKQIKKTKYWEVNIYIEQEKIGKRYKQQNKLKNTEIQDPHDPHALSK